MGKLAIVTDSACDLPQTLLEELQIRVVPLILRMGGETYQDGDLSMDDFWQRVEDEGQIPSTSQPSVGAFESVFEDLVTEGYHVLCLTLSSKVSGTFLSAQLAAQRFIDQVTVFDTLFWSLPQGYQVLEAARAALRGEGLPQIIEMLEGIRERTHVMLSMDTLSYAIRGGRFDAVVAPIRKLLEKLSIKPVVEVVGGRPRSLGLTRSISKSMSRIREEILCHESPEFLFIVHSRLAEKARAFADKLATEMGLRDDQVMVAELGIALASHGGPGAIGGGIVEGR